MKFRWCRLFLWHMLAASWSDRWGGDLLVKKVYNHKNMRSYGKCKEKSQKEDTSVKYDEEREKEDISVKYEREREKEKLIEKYDISGNYTVEAAFIVPMILGIVFAIMYMLFLLHDKVILQENLRTAVLSIAQSENVSAGDVSADGLAEKIGKSAESSLGKKVKNGTGYKELVSKNLIVLKVKNADCNVGTKYVTAKANAIAKMDIPVIAYFMKKKNKICLKTRCLKLKPESMLRRKSESVQKNAK